MIDIDEQEIQKVMEAVKCAAATAKNAKGMRVVLFSPDDQVIHHAVMLAFQALALPGTVVKSSATTVR